MRGEEGRWERRRKMRMANSIGGTTPEFGMRSCFAYWFINQDGDMERSERDRTGLQTRNGCVGLTMEKLKWRKTHFLRNIYPEFISDATYEALLRGCVNHTLFYLRPGGTRVDEDDRGF